ncbi:hypothetical protein [uncultured Anaerococcus sp.]|uniref:hypothetical protein n=1 Tax=uncultured Anaerococcus sp. TaxID=293428 RepID=UPI0025E42A61|nr:hypothetical protein [uncultured Anaerococcus sp.]
MKKILALLIIALSLSACGNQTEIKREKSLARKKQVEESKEQEESQEDEEIKRTYPEDKEEEVKKEVIPVENQQDSDNPDEEEKDEDTKENHKESEDDREDEKALTGDDYFFSYYDLVTVKDGEVVDALEEEGFNKEGQAHEKEYSASYIPYSNNIFVLGSYVKNDFSIRKISGKDLTTLYDFGDNETLIPLGIIGDKVYGMYSYYEENGNNDTLIRDKSGLAEVNLKTGKIGVYKATRTVDEESVIGVGITDKEAVFTKLEKDASTSLYKIDFEKDFDQEAELIEKDTKANFVMSAKHFDKDKPVYEIFKSEENEMVVKDQRYPMNDTERISFIGENIIIQKPVKFDESDHLFRMDIINYLTGEVVEKDIESFGYRVANGKLYYIDYDKEVKALDIGL